MISQRRHITRTSVFILMLFLAGGVFAVEMVNIRNQMVLPRGTSFDYYLVWLGSREILAGHNPYTTEIAGMIQQGLLGHPAGAGQNQYYFVYPPHVALLLACLVQFPFEWSVTAWLVTQQFFLAETLLLVLKTLKWQPRVAELVALALGSAALRYTWVVLVPGQTTFFILFLLAGAMYASRTRRDEVTGLLLALATCKPQLVLLPIVGWGICMLKTRSWRPMLVFLAALALLWLLPSVVIGNWIPEWLEFLSLSVGYNETTSAATVLLAGRPANGSGLIISAAILALGLLAWHPPANRVTIFTASILLTVLVIPVSSVYDLALLLIPWYVCLFLVRACRRWDRIWTILAGDVPLLSWAIVILLPGPFELMQLPFDAASLDKVLIPVLLLSIFLGVGRLHIRANSDHQEMLAIARF